MLFSLFSQKVVFVVFSTINRHFKVSESKQCLFVPKREIKQALWGFLIRVKANFAKLTFTDVWMSTYPTKTLTCLKQLSFSPKTETSSVRSCFLQKFLVFLFLHLFLAFCTCFLFYALVSCFGGVHHMSKYLSSSPENHVIREVNFSVPVRLLIPTVSAHFEGLRILLNFKKFLKILFFFSSKKLYFQRRRYGRIFVGLG